ncbi:MAG: hypothetical protein ACRDMV_21020 [Streptosporangiales bacterium]
MTPDDRQQAYDELRQTLYDGYDKPSLKGPYQRRALDAALNAVLARPDLIRAALGMTLWSVEFRTHDGATRVSRDEPDADQIRKLWATPWQPTGEDPEAEAEFWRDHYDQATDDAEREAGAW